MTVRLALLSLGTFLVGTNGFIIAGLLPDIAEGLTTTPSGVGVSITVYAAVVAVLAPTFATLLARVPRAGLIAAGLVLVAIGTALTAVAADLPVFVLGRALAGVGGAAIVPTAVAAAALLVPANRRAWAIAIVMLGLTLSTTIGSPVGTAVAHVGGWRLPLAGVAVLAAASAVVVPLLVRGVPIGPPLSVARRLSVLGEPRILFALLSTVFTIAGFNAAYIFSSTFTADATGGSGALFAVLLLLFGVGGVFGNQVAGRLTDRFGNRRVASILMPAHVVILVLMPFAEPSFPALAGVFLIWGFAAFGTGIPVQHSLASVDPDRATVAVSWYSPAVYVGIAIAPLIGGGALAVVGPSQIPRVAALSVVVAAVLFQVGFVIARRADAAARLAT
jgi:MFS transporter, DHA1 family, inner membrane transport protein